MIRTSGLPILLGALCCLLQATASQKFPFFSDATSTNYGDAYDYIVVGGGTAGCAIAATLSEKYRVLVLERGKSPYENPLLMRKENFVLTMVDQFDSQAFISTDRVLNARGRVLGGGSSINAGFYDRASTEEIQSIGLDYALVNASYKWVEDALVSIPTLGPFQTAFRNGLLEVGVLPDNGRTVGHLVGTKTGGSIFNDSGTRHPSSDLFVYANRSNIQVVLQAVVQRILFSDNVTARGVEFTDRLGNVHTVLLSNSSSSEVIVSAGAIGSPQLLMLSGIGPRDHLQQMGINPVLDLPTVGQNIADNPSTRVYIPTLTPSEIALVQVVGITSFGSYIESLASPQGLPVDVIFQKVIGPRSSGQIRLLTLNADDNPLITFNYFQDPVDLEICIAGANKVEELLLSRSLSSFVSGIQPIPSGGVVALPSRRFQSQSQTNESLALFCKSNVATMWHYHGSCRVGQVVDPQYQVLGTNRLRVVDGSVFNFCPGTNPQATFMMLGRYMGVKIVGERGG